MSLKNAVRDLTPDIETKAAEMGFEIIEIKCSHQHLEIILDRPGGITLDECAHFSRRVETILDTHANEIIEHYELDVSSPGLYRPLTKPAHYEKAVGERIFVEMDKPRAGRRRFTGILKEVTPERLILVVEGVEGDTLIEMSEVGKAHLDPLLNWK